MIPLASVVPATPEGYAIGAADLFTVLFIVIGPLKLIAAFARETRALDAVQVRRLAGNATLAASVSILAGGFAGSALLAQWGLDPQILLLSVGLVFFVVAFRVVLQPYAPPGHAPEPTTPQVLQIVFPWIAPPHGVAAVIVLLALSHDARRSLLVSGMVVAVLLLDWLAMLYARSIMRGFGVALMQVLGAVMGVLQVALAVRIILQALAELGVLA
jgi:multiple antibiotic resistance protein